MLGGVGGTQIEELPLTIGIEISFSSSACHAVISAEEATSPAGSAEYLELCSSAIECQKKAIPS